MKTHRLLLVAALWSVIVFFCAASASAQNYQIDWFTLDGGGGASAGGQFTLTGTIGQPDAGELAGGSYVLEGGFWPGIVPQSGAPRLFIERSGTGVTISWDPNTPGFYLQESPTVGPASWSNSASGSSNPAVLPAAAASRFYQLNNQ